VVNGLIELLIRLDVVQTDDVVAAVEATRKEIADAGQQASLDVAIRADGEAPPVPADAIDCDARLPVCKAVCCRLRFALTVEEIESGPVKWDLGRPYFNRHGVNGYCHQIDDETLGCNVYDERPLVCRQYSCAGDTRIWKDFDAMEINQEWIDGHLGAERSPIEIFMSAYEGGAG
jgi:Fe-S-cluster containining protein